MLTQKLNDTVLGHGFASSTPVSDGELVYTFFGPTGVFAFDMEGNLVWEQNVGWQFNFFGSSASLTTHKDLLIVNASIENQTIYALDKKTGKGVWKADNIDRCYSLPVFGEAPDGSIEMVVVEEDEVYGFDPKTGEKLWWCRDPQLHHCCSRHSRRYRVLQRRAGTIDDGNQTGGPRRCHQNP